MKFVAILLASIAFTEANQLAQDGPIEYEFSNNRCGEWRLSQGNECDESCMGTDDDTVGCAQSWPIGDPAKWNSEFATCRCNQRPFAYSHNEKPLEKCGGCEEGETCHKSWPFFKKNVPWSEKEFRCKGPLEAPEEEFFVWPALPEELVIEEAEEPINADATDAPTATIDDTPSTPTPAEEAVTAGDVEPTTEDFEDMFDQIDTADDLDWESVTEDESDFQTVEEDEVCENTDNGITDDYGDGCDDYAVNTEWCGLYDSENFKSMDMCCACKNLEPINPHAADFDLDTCEDNMDVEDVYGDDCSDYWGNEHWCGLYDFYGEGIFSAFDAFIDCCACQALSGEEYIAQLSNIADNWGSNNPDDY